MLRRLWTRKDGSAEGDAAPAPSPVPPQDIVREAFWLLLWRAPSDGELRESVRAMEGGQSVEALLTRLTVSSEFRMLVTAVQQDEATGRRRTETDAGLEGLGHHDHFVDAAYRALLGRDADPDGRAFYVGHLVEGRARQDVLRALLTSTEFSDRYQALAPQAGFIPRDVQLCELANPAKWDNREWLDLMKSLVVVPPDRQSMHRKAYEFTQLLFGLTRLGFVRDDAQVVSVGAGHEPVLYWLANRVGRVVATDMYGGIWQGEGAQEGHETVLDDASQFAPFSYRNDRIVFLKMDGRYLAFADATFDVAYSLSSIEHFGGFEGARAAVADMARVLKPGGILALATEYCLSGPPHHEAFQPSDVHALLDHPSLTLVQPIDEHVWDRYEYRAIDLWVNRHQTPHMVVSDRGSVFTSVMVFLRKNP